MAIAPGARLGHYEIEAVLGAGGMGEVYRARDLHLQRLVAIKVLRGDIDATSRHRFEREALSASALNHPHILTVHEAGEDAGVRFLVTEFVDGGTLATWAQSASPSWRSIGELLAGVAEGLAAAHRAGVLHRDVKPENILVSSNGYAKLADFGLATLAGGASLDSAAVTATDLRTQPGVIVGTIAYMSPEQANAQRLDGRSDVFSFGVVLYELLARRRPFAGATPMELIQAITVRPAPPLPSDVPGPMAAIVHKALEKDPANRYQTMAELASDLRRVLREPAAAVEPGAARARRVDWIVAAAAVALAVAALVWLGVSTRDAPGGGDTQVRTLAVLPLKPLVSGGDDGQLGLGLADTIITRVGQIEGLTVRPTSAVRRYADPDASALAVAGELNVDAVLDGTLQRAGNRLRVNMTLLRVRDGATLWSQTFNTGFEDVFAVEDEIATGVVAQIRPRLSDAERIRLTKRQTSSPEAYEYYVRGVAAFGPFGAGSATVTGNVADGIPLLERAVAIDPGYALAHARLAWAYAWLSKYGSPDPSLRTRAQDALARAEAIDPNLAESHVVRSMLLMTRAAGYQIVPAFEALRAAQAINPNVGQYELGTFLAELGLMEPALRAYRRAIEIDPTNESARAEMVNAYWSNALYDEAIAANRELPRPVAWSFAYYIGAGRLDEGQRMVDEALARDPANGFARSIQALLLAWRGRHAEARNLLSSVTPPDPANQTYHHAAYLHACIFALGGAADDAVKWMRETVDNGLVVYPAFNRDRCFDPVRQSAPFTRFMSDLKPIWEGYERLMR